MTEHILVSPLGFAAGAVSGVYFALEKQGVKVDRIITVGTAHSHVRNAAAILEMLFRRVGEVDYKPCYIDAVDLRGRERDASGPFAARMGLYIDQARQAGQTVHVAVTGGRSGMGALAALAAQLYRANHLYHLWVNEEIEREGIARAEPDPKNRYVNPTIENGLYELVSLPFADLSKLVDEVQRYREGAQPTADWSAGQLVGEAPSMLEALTHYVPAGLSLDSARELLDLIEQWRSQVEWIAEDAPDKIIKVPTVNDAKQKEIWQRALSILYTAGALDDDSRDRLRGLMRDSVADDYAQRSVDRAREKDDLGFFKWLAGNKDALTVLVALIGLGANVGTFVLKGLELWMKAQGMI
jgi:hypothetical protein